MTPAQRRARRIIGAVLVALGLAIAGIAVSSAALSHLMDSQCAPGDASCADGGALLWRLAMIPGGFGILVVGIGLLLRRAGRRLPGDSTFAPSRLVMDRATRYRAGVTALTFAAAVACWIFSLEPWAGTFAFMGALFAMTTVMMQRRKLL